ncbi:hypothetical protein GHT06_011212 [Daphnia sinensis]|uniref:Uncharacterized protein n=1 Tax=Daphnia sinensis TaxID=1820382 RepID=A0AAD5LTK0_9CRUS|nr:hypothetical protein GHT06_011212 [Daphnia sinensis]
MAATRLPLTFSLLIATSICLMGTKAEEQQVATQAIDLQDKLIDLTTFHPSLSLECLSTNIATDGLGPCKVATNAERGVINIHFSNEIQTAVIGIVADSQKHTRVKLICTEINQFVRLYTQSGEIKDTTDTPRIEVGYMQVIATVPDSNTSGGVGSDLAVKCSWVSYNHHTAAYP